LIESIKKAFGAYSKTPFPFVWASLLCVFLLIVCVLAAVGLFLIYFMLLSAFEQELVLDAIPTMVVAGVIVLLFLFFANGLNAALIMAYRKALAKEKISVARFFSYAVDRAPEMSGIMVVREFILLLLIGPFLAIYIYFLQEYEFMDILFGTYALFMIFAAHVVFKPAFVLAGGYGTDIFNSLKLTIDFLRRKHIFFIGLYILFALVWLLNFVPFVQIATLFFAYPVVYAAMIVIIENSVKIREV